MNATILFKLFVRRNLIRLFYKLYSKPEGRKLLFESVPYIGEFSNNISNDLTCNHANPYHIYDSSDSRADIKNRSNVIFVTGRFRSGSTLLWNIFRDLADTTSFYEPFNERQWFNQKLRGSHVDTTHLGVNDYWSEYNGLSNLSKFYREHWIDHNLFMSKNSWDPNMLSYIDELIRSGKKRVVLQFNRMDFRLAWIRRHYPRAKIVHVYRNPREQWLSCIKSSENCEPADSIKSLGTRDFFNLRRWGRDLRYIYPFLDEDKLGHLYELFYLLWRLSYNHGVNYSDYSFAFEDLCDNPKKILSELFSTLDVDTATIHELQTKIKNKTSQKWQKYADENWFFEMENNCENTLTNFITPINLN